MDKNILWTILGLVVIALIAWFLVAQTEVDGNATDDSAQVTVTADTDYSDDINRAEQEFAEAAAAVEADIEAGAEASVERLITFVNGVEATAEVLGLEAQEAYQEFIASARATIADIQARIPDVDVDVEVNETEDGNTSAAN